MKIKEESKTKMKMIDGKNFYETSNANGDVYFNKNHFASDTEGPLKGTVYYVQNSTIPAHNHIAGDIQPHLVTNRKLMVLFKPDEKEFENIFLNVRGENGQVILTKTLIHDDDKIPLCEQESISGDIDFIPPDTFDLVITEDDEIKKIATDVNYFDDVLLKNKSVKIITSDYNFSPVFSLRNDSKFSNDKILFVCNSGYGFEIIRSGKDSIKLRRGEEIYLLNVNGKWLTYSDAEYSLIKYMENTWHVSIPAAIVNPGISLEFFTSPPKGHIKNIKIGAPNKLLLNTISIGMLTPYIEKFDFQEDPEYHRQYFQQVPLSQLIVSQYDPVYLKEVMMPDGELLTDRASGNGGWHEGTLREFIAKDLIAKGINYANYGYMDSGVYKDKPLATAQITVHISVGKYENGVQVHGGSGGAGMATLTETIGNEFSHEVGHNYGLGHYPGGFYGSVDQPANVRNSAWGWDSDNNFFLPNFEKNITNKSTYLGEKSDETLSVEPFHGHSFGRDAMAGGGPMYPESNAFTLHTPYVLSEIQSFLESKAVFNPASPTGYSIWDNQMQKMKPHEVINNSVTFFDMPVRNGINITADELNNYFDKNMNVLIRCYDGRHAPYVYLPESSSSNKGLIAKFEIDSGYTVDVHVNGNFERLRRGTVISYISDGKCWLMTNDDLSNTAIVPYKQGVKVITLLGYYDPEGKMNSYIYPALNGSFGNVYNYDIKSNCYIEVECATGKKLNFPLTHVRIESNYMNKFHVNIERDLHPTTIKIYNGNKLLTQEKITLGSDDLLYTVNGAPFE